MYICNLGFTNAKFNADHESPENKKVKIMARKQNNTHSFTCDNDTWELAGILLGNKRSKFIENQLKEYINSHNDIDELRKEIEDDEQSLNAKKQKLADLEEIQQRNSQNKEKVNNAMDTVKRIVGKHGGISEQQIRNIASANEIDRKHLRKEVKMQGFRITKYTPE